MGLMDYYSGPKPWAQGLSSFAGNAMDAYTKIKGINLAEDRLAEEVRQANQIQLLREAQMRQMAQQEQAAMIENQKQQGLMRDFQALQQGAQSQNLVEVGPDGQPANPPLSAPQMSQQYAQALSRYYPEKGIPLMIEGAQVQPRIGLMGAQTQGALAGARHSDAQTDSILQMIAPTVEKTRAEGRHLDSQTKTEGSKQKYYDTESDKNKAEAEKISGEKKKHINTIMGLNSLIKGTGVPQITIDPTQDADPIALTHAIQSVTSQLSHKYSSDKAADKRVAAAEKEAIKAGTAMLKMEFVELGKDEDRRRKQNSTLGFSTTNPEEYQANLIAMGQIAQKREQIRARMNEWQKYAAEHYKLDVDPLPEREPEAKGSTGTFEVLGPGHSRFTR